MAVITDKRTLVENTYEADVVSAQDYTPFGSVMTGRAYSIGGAAGYRYGFNGKENDNEVKGEGNSVDFGARIYDSRIGRWFSADAYSALHPGWNPYRAFFDNPINWIDSDGDIEAPLRGTHTRNNYNSSKIKYDHFVKANGITTKVGRMYDYAYKRSGENVTYTAEQASADKNGMLITVNSEFFAIRTVGTRPHVGVDYRARTPKPFYSLSDGEIVGKGETNGTGNYLVVQYGNGDKVRFMHLSSYTTGMDVGAKVYEGQILGQTGNTGKYKNKKGVWKSYDPHLHVDAVTQDGTTVSPLSGAYGTVSNEDFFTKFNGDYKKLLEFKQNGSKDNKILKADDTKMEAKPDNTRVGSGYGF